MGLDGLPVAGPSIQPHDVAALRLRINNRGVRRIRLLVHPVAEIGLAPVAVQDADLVLGGARPHPRMSVLSSRIDIVGLVHVHGDPVELTERDVVHFSPVKGAVPRQIESTVTSEDEMFRISRVDPECMMVAVHADVIARRHISIGLEARAAVLGHVERRGEHVHAVRVGRVDENLAVVHRSRVELVDSLPTLAAIRRAIDARLGRVFDESV